MGTLLPIGSAKITVRPLLPHEFPLWGEFGFTEQDRALRLLALERYLAANPGLPPENYLLAFRGDQLVGKLSGIKESDSYLINRITVRPGIDPVPVCRALITALGSEGRLEAASWVRAEDADWDELLRALSFEVFQDKPYFRRSLLDYRSPYEFKYTRKSLAELGDAAFMKAFATTYESQPNRNFTTPEADFASHRESAGALFDPQEWFVAFEGAESLGVCLPQRFPDIPTEGTIMSLGLAPKFRRLGIGRMLHAEGLAALARLGAKEYVGSTDARNGAMVRVFSRERLQALGRAAVLSVVRFDVFNAMC